LREEGDGVPSLESLDEVLSFDQCVPGGAQPAEDLVAVLSGELR
jgi:hypothetical protein